MATLPSRPRRSSAASWAYYLAVLAWAGTTAMHIPDGYLSPATSAVMFLMVLPFWIRGMGRLGRGAGLQRVPLAALVAAFSFVIMLFNVPLPGGTTGHAVGAALAGILLGPEIAVVSISLALIIQALFFADGGILAIGANCFNLAVVVPFMAAAVYRLVSGTRPLLSKRRVVAAGIAGWAGLSMAALLTGVELGIQPLLFRTSSGAPLYAPYSLAIAIPAMVLPHVLIASVIEGLITALVFAYLQRANPLVLESTGLQATDRTASRQQRLRSLWIGLIVLALVSPLGLLAPGTAWGEWGIGELRARGLDTIPEGLQRLSGLWGAPFAGYAVPGFGNLPLGYALSAILGTVIIGILAWLYSALMSTDPKARDSKLE